MRVLTSCLPRTRGSAIVVSLTVLFASALTIEGTSQNRRRGRQTPPPTAVKVRIAHPVDAPPIENAVILMQGPRILAVGPADSIEIPEGATVIDHGEAHAYPGLVDALSTAYCPPQVRGDTNTNAGTEISEALDPYDRESARLIESGVTTAYVSNRSSATWRGVGTIVRPRAGSFARMRNSKGALHLRMSQGDQPSHALSRVETLSKVGDVFDQLEKYEEAKTEFDEKLADYEKDWKKYIEHHEKKQKADDTKKG